MPEQASNLILSFLASSETHKQDIATTSLALTDAVHSSPDEAASSLPELDRISRLDRHTSDGIVQQHHLEIDKMDCYIKEWKPSTTQSLLSPSSTIGACDIIDHTFGKTFLTNLKLEVHSSDLFKRLKPAKTAMDHTINDLATSLSSFTGQNLNQYSTSARDDLSVIIPRSFRAKPQFQSQYPFLHSMILSIEHSAKRNLENESTSSKIEFDSLMTSVQFAIYPGDANSGYARHCDTGSQCNHEVTEKQSDSTQYPIHDKAQRIITAVYYLTEDDWQIEDGGCLRIFDNTRDSKNSHDIVPHADRLVLFRSDLVEHEVLPSTKKTRMAITVWLYGRFISRIEKVSAKNQKEVSNPIKKSCIEIQDSVSHKVFVANKQCVLPINVDSSSHDSENIFVSIPAYRDTETHPTILSLLENASFPNRIYIGVVYQYDISSGEEQLMYQGLRSSLPLPWSASNFRSLTLDCRDATGPCYARYLAQSLHRNEEYILQIDSHMRFRPKWDEYLIQQLHRCEHPERSVLTTYPPGYSLPNFIPLETRATILVPWKFDKDKMLRQKGRLLRNSVGGNEKDINCKNIRCLLFAGGFNFSSSLVMKICPYDGTLHHLFFGEEISMAIRLYTSGIDLFTPPTTVCYHLWSRSHRTTFQTDFGVSAHISDHATKDDKSSSIDTIRRLCLGEGLRSVRSIDKFWKELGVDFDGEISRNAGNAGLEPYAFVSPTSTIEMKTELVQDALEVLLKRNPRTKVERK